MKTPYTYLIGWTAHNKWYYGVRYGENCSPEDLWRSYFTSSKYVTEARSVYGEPDVVEVRQTFDCEEKALFWEKKVLQNMNVLYDDKWFNKNIGGSIYLKEQTKQHIEKRTKNKKHNPNQKSIALKASKIAAEKRKGQKDSEETKLKRSNSLKEFYKNNQDHKRSPRKKFIIDGEIYFGLKSIKDRYKIKNDASIYHRLKSEKYPNWMIDE